MAGIAVDEVGLIPDDGDLGFEIPEDEEGLLALANSGEYNSGGETSETDTVEASGAEPEVEPVADQEPEPQQTDAERRAEAAEARLKMLEEQVARYQQSQADKGQEQQPVQAAPDEDALLSPEERAKVAALEDEYGGEFAGIARQNMILQKQVMETTRYVQDAMRREREVEERSVQQAIEANPVMSAWQKEGGQKWTQVGQVHEMLSRMDQGYAAKSWAEKIPDLERRASVIFGGGKSPSSPNQQSVAARNSDTRQMPSTAPVSLSNIPGGTPAKGEEDIDVTTLGGAEMQETMMRMAQAGKLDEFLGGIH